MAPAVALALALAAAPGAHGECGDAALVLSPDGRPACVSEESAAALEGRGWDRPGIAWHDPGARLPESFAVWAATGDGGWRVTSAPEIEAPTATRGRRPSGEPREQAA